MKAATEASNEFHPANDHVYRTFLLLHLF